MGNENKRNLNWEDNNWVERKESKRSLGRAGEWHHDMMQMQQQKTQKMQMNFVQAQQQQSQLY